MAVSLNYIWPATGATPPTSYAANGASGTKMIVDVTATADGDVTATIPHLMGVAPKEVYLTPLLSQALTALSAWAATTINTTNVVLTKLASTGSGNALAQVRVIIGLPNTLQL